jgi:hypothetical protein
MAKTKAKTIRLHTSAPEAYDGFSTKTVRVVGTDLKNGNPVREITIDEKDYDWQTSRYGSGNHRFTNDFMKLEDYSRLGDWAIGSAAYDPAPEIEPKGGRAPAYVTRLREDLDRVTKERDEMAAKIRELLSYVGSDKFKDDEYVHVGDVINRLR